MKILDIRGNLVKLESKEPFQVSSLLKVSSEENCYLAQVLYVEHTAGVNMAFAKLLANFEAPLEPIEINTVSTDAVCEKINFSDIISNFGENTDIVLGQLCFENTMPTADFDFFNNRLLIVSENNDSCNILVNNFAHQIKNNGYNTIIFDTEGFCDGIKLTAGLDFKLPLNEHAIDFIYDKYFSDITEESKAQITDIFTELKAYAATVPYIPFNTFKSVIDDVFDYSQNLSLYFFKTKLEKLYEANIFANTHEEVMDWSSLSEFGPGKIVVDLSHVSKIFVPEYVSLVVNSFNNTDEKLFAFAKLEDSYTDKDFLKEILENKNVIVSGIVRSDFKYISALKQNCGSFVVLGGIKKPENFDYCKFLLKNISSDKYVITGPFSQPLSMIFQLKEINEVVARPESLPEEEPIAETILEPMVDATEQAPVYEPIEEAPNEEDELEQIDTPIEDYTPITSDQNIEQSETSPTEENKQVETSEEIQKINSDEVSDSEEENDIPLEELMIAENVIIDIPEEDNEIPDVSDEAQVLNISDSTKEETLETEIADYEPINATQEEQLEELPEMPIEELPETEFNELYEMPIEETPKESFSEEEASSIIEESIEEFSLIDNDDLQFPETEVAEPLEEAPLEFSLVDTYELPTEDSVEEVLLAEEKTPEEILDEQIRRDVDRVYTAQTPESDELSEDDLDFIEELVGNEEILVEDETIEEITLPEDNAEEEFLVQDSTSDIAEPAPALQEDDAILKTQNTATPAVPIYAAEIPEESIVQSDPIQQGDRVIHVKFGIGVVEKIFSYGTKNFCSINFENIGRKVLDPNVTELKRA